jgi:hypothetical protein
MIIVTTIHYPTDVTDEIAKRFLEAPQIPAFMVRRGPYISTSLKKGVIALSLYELDNSKIADGMEFLGSYMANFFGVSGFKYENRVFLEIKEALKTIGMA